MRHGTLLTAKSKSEPPTGCKINSARSVRPEKREGEDGLGEGQGRGELIMHTPFGSSGTRYRPAGVGAGLCVKGSCVRDARGAPPGPSPRPHISACLDALLG